MIRVCIFFGFFLLALTLSGQSKMEQVIAPAGSFKIAPGGTYYIGWTLGETLVSTWKSSDGSTIISSGMQQKVMLTTIEETPGLKVKVLLYPNPVGTILTIKFIESLENKISLYLLNISGRIIFVKDLEETSRETQIDMDRYPSGVYYLKIIDGIKSNTYKVVKL